MKVQAAWITAIGFAWCMMSNLASAGPLTLCEILKLPAVWDEKTVRFQSEYETTPEDFSAMFTAKGCRGFVEDVTKEGAGDQSVHSFEKAITGLPQTFAVEVSGRFHWNRSWKSSSALLQFVKPHAQGQLELTRVWQFREIK
jgi:hypothetical protein